MEVEKGEGWRSGAGLQEESWLSLLPSPGLGSLVGLALASDQVDHERLQTKQTTEQGRVLLALPPVLTAELGVLAQLRPGSAAQCG